MTTVKKIVCESSPQPFASPISFQIQFRQKKASIHPLPSTPPIIQLPPFIMPKMAPSYPFSYSPLIPRIDSLVKLELYTKEEFTKEEYTKEEDQTDYSETRPKKEEHLSISYVSQSKEEEEISEPFEHFRGCKMEIPINVGSCFGRSGDPEDYLEPQIKYLVEFFVANLGVASSEDFEAEKAKYLNNRTLYRTFEALEKKYSLAGKTREEMIKWIIRQCIKYNKELIKEASKKASKKVKKGLLKRLYVRYFKGFDVESTEAWVESLLPFKKNSKNKTINTHFVYEIFRSEEFKADYHVFLDNYDRVCEKENSERINRFTALVVDCAKKGSFKAVNDFRRPPWLKLWFQNTKKFAYELLEEQENRFKPKGPEENDPERFYPRNFFQI